MHIEIAMVDLLIEQSCNILLNKICENKLEKGNGECVKATTTRP